MTKRVRLNRKNKEYFYSILLISLIVSSLIQFPIVEAKTIYALNGWRVSQNKWIGGNLFTFYEDEWVPYRLNVNGFDGNDLNICIQHDFFDQSGHFGVDETRNWFIGPTVGQTIPPENITAIYYPGSVFNVIGPTYINGTTSDEIQYCFNITNASALIALEDFTFYWEAHLAIGSSNWNGASLHTQTTVTGNQDVPISLPPSEGAQEVDVIIVKYGPLNATIGENVTYRYNVTNQGANDALNITVEDNVCGLGTYISGDTNNDKILQSSETWVFECNHTISIDDPDPLVNLVTVATSSLDTNMTNNQDTWSIDILRTRISIEKTGPSYAHQGDTYNYTFVVENTGETEINITSIVDDLLSDLSSSLPSESLGVGEQIEFNVTHTVTSPENIENTVNITGVNKIGLDPANSSDTHIVDVLNPSISVNKSADKITAYELENITYTFNISNTGDTPLKGVLVYDSILGLLFAGNLEANETKVIIFEVPPGAPDPLVNNVTALGYDALGLEVNSTDSWVVDVLHPRINVTKVGNVSAVIEPYVVNYTIFVENIGDIELNVTLDDPATGEVINIGTISPSHNYTHSYVYNITDLDSDPFINTVNATGIDPFGTVVNDTAFWLVDIYTLGINVTKIGNTTLAHVGDVVEYNITVINTEEATLNVAVNDTTLAYYNSSVTLGPGENASYIIYHTINETDDDPFLNSVNVTGVDTQFGSTVHMHDSWIVDILHPAIQVNKTSTHPTVCSEYCNGTYIIAVKNIGDTTLYNITIDDDIFGPHPTPPDHLHPEDVFSWFFDAEITNDTLNTVNVSGTDVLSQTVNASDSAFVNFIHPRINITKNANTTIIHEGDPVEFTYFVENIGDDPLNSVNITDDIYGKIHGPVDLGPGENLTATKIGFPTQNETNTATVSGFNSLNIRISNSTNETITVLHPRIEIEKAGPDKAQVGDNITYTIMVRNTGDTPLDPVNISDPMFGGQIWSGNLDPDENHTVQVNYIIPESSTIDNTATARGKDLLGLIVENQSSWTVDVLNPSIRIDKEAPEQGVPGEIINYTITIINTGDTPLYSVNVIDTTLGFNITIPGPFTGSKSWIIPFKIPTKVSEINNTATVTAQDLLGGKVSSSDTERVEVVYPVGGEIMTYYQGEALRAVALALVLITGIFIAQRKELIQVHKRTQP